MIWVATILIAFYLLLFACIVFRLIAAWRREAKDPGNETIEILFDEGEEDFLSSGIG